MKSLVLIWLLVVVSLVGGTVWFNHEVGRLVAEVKPGICDGFQLSQCSILKAGDYNQTMSEITESSDIQPALGFRVVQDAAVYYAQ